MMGEIVTVMMMMMMAKLIASVSQYLDIKTMGRIMKWIIILPAIFAKIFANPLCLKCMRKFSLTWYRYKLG